MNEIAVDKKNTLMMSNRWNMSIQHTVTVFIIYEYVFEMYFKLHLTIITYANVECTRTYTI